jgi:hypothetical protein
MNLSMPDAPTKEIKKAHRSEPYADLSFVSFIELQYVLILEGIIWIKVD